MIRVALLGVGAVLLAAAGSAPLPDLAGDWTRRDGQTRIRISPCGDSLCAVNTWVRDPAADERPGDTLRMTLEPTSPTQLSGRAYDERRNMTYAMTITVDASGMRTSGCILLGMLCKSAEWTRTR